MKVGEKRIKETWKIARGQKSAPYKAAGLVSRRDQDGVTYLRRVYRHRAWEWLGGPLDCAYSFVAPGEIIEYVLGDETPAWGLAVMVRGKIKIVRLDAVQVGDKWQLSLPGVKDVIVVPDPGC